METISVYYCRKSIDFFLFFYSLRGRSREEISEEHPCGLISNPIVPSFCQARIIGRSEASRSVLRVPGQWYELPDARASSLDLSVLRSSRIAGNSSYFVLIRKFVHVRSPTFNPLELRSVTSFLASSGYPVRWWTRFTPSRSKGETVISQVIVKFEIDSW